MPFSDTDFLKKVDAINRENYVFGNEILYNMCADIDEVLPGIKADTAVIKRFGSAIWLIGRAYSASPERIKKDESDDGLGDFFWRLAERITEEEQYTCFREQICDLRNKTYKYDASAADKELLIQSVHCVKLLNKIICAATKKMVGTERNNVSFCSKFLHFLLPDVFFIIDSYSHAGGCALFKTGAGKSFCGIDIDADAVKFFSDKYVWQNVDIDKIGADSGFFPGKTEKKIGDFNAEERSMRDYWHHGTRAYSVGKWLSDERKACEPQIAGNPNSCYMPRLVDSVLMRVKK